MGKNNQYGIGNVSTLRDFFLTVLTGGIPMSLIKEMCDDIDCLQDNSQAIGIDQYWLVLREFAPIVADCLAFDQLTLSFKEFASNESVDNLEIHPVSNKDGFSFLTELRDDELRFALASISDNPIVRYELYDIVKDGEYDAYKQYLRENKISSYLLNKRIALYELNTISITEGQELVKNTLFKPDDELGLEDYAYIEKLKNASPDLIDSRMDNILSMIETAEKDESISDEQMIMFLEYPLSLIKFTIIETQNKEEKELNPYEKQLLALRSSPYYAILENFNSCLEDTALKSNKNELWSAVNVIQNYNDSFEAEIADKSSVNNETIKTKTIRKEDGMPIPISPISERKRLDFPTRLTSEKLLSPSSISAQEQEPVLREIYNIYGGSFENMSCEEFLFLFGAAFVKQPASYHPPYYWLGNESAMKALLRILYIQQPRSLKELILHIADKETGVKGHNWSRNKNRVPYRDIEANIIKIVHRITGKTLKEL